MPQAMPQTTGELNLVDRQATHDLGCYLGKTLEMGTSLLLTGDLGTGKTALVQGIGAGLGIQDSLESPTFTILNEYDSGRVPLYHLDLYRLTPVEVAELYLEGYWEGTEAPLGIMAIEWCDRLPYRPDAYLSITLEHSETGRHLRWESIGNIVSNPFLLPLPSLGEGQSFNQTL
jgi:tRNA threonylcarbamoyladenosine biosynthesis protein TsaE